MRRRTTPNFKKCFNRYPMTNPMIIEIISDPAHEGMAGGSNSPQEEKQNKGAMDTT